MDPKGAGVGTGFKEREAIRAAVNARQAADEGTGRPLRWPPQLWFQPTLMAEIEILWPMVGNEGGTNT